MKFLQTIRSKPQEEKVRVIWAVLVAVTILLILVWILTARYSKRLSGDMSLLQTIGRGLHDVRTNYNK